MKQEYKVISSIIILIIIFISGCAQKETGLENNNKQIEVVKGPVVVNQIGGAAMLIAECSNKTYVSNIADFIVAGTVEKVESKWNEEKTNIYTYSDFLITDYLKGKQIENNTLTIVTPGGCVGDICESVEDMPIFHEQKNVVIYFQEYKGGFTIVCGNFGVEEIQETVVT